MNNPAPQPPSDTTEDYTKMVYQQICTDLENIADFRLKLFGFLPIATAGSFLLVSWEQ
jgi:hypothetical protein